MKFSRLSIKDRKVFDRFLSLSEHSLSAYAFENIFIWKSLYDVFWTKIEESLCVFFKDRMGCFLYLPPLSEHSSGNVVSECFNIMNRLNSNTAISRIENVDKNDTEFYKKLGYRIILGGRDYICKKQDMASLKGSNLKKKRSAVNFFVKNYDFKYQPYTAKDKKDCLDLYCFWMKARKEKNQDAIYQGLLDDNFTIFKTALDYYDKLNLIARTIRVEDEIKAVTAGYALNQKTFVVLFEICDLSLKGIAQYIFSEFCKESNHKDINIMDDSGLDNLKKVKLSYRPYKIVDNFVVADA